MRSMCVSNDLDSSMRIVVLFLRVIILEGLSGELVLELELIIGLSHALESIESLSVQSLSVVSRRIYSY